MLKTRNNREINEEKVNKKLIRKLFWVYFEYLLWTKITNNYYMSNNQEILLKKDTVYIQYMIDLTRDLTKQDARKD